jgi:hypothetical protein
MIPGTKKRKLKLKKKDSEASSSDDQPKQSKKLGKRRRSSRGFLNNYERLLKHRESRTALKENV